MHQVKDYTGFLGLKKGGINPICNRKQRKKSITKYNKKSNAVAFVDSFKLVYGKGKKAKYVKKEFNLKQSAAAKFYSDL